MSRYVRLCRQMAKRMLAKRMLGPIVHVMSKLQVRSKLHVTTEKIENLYIIQSNYLILIT